MTARAPKPIIFPPEPLAFWRAFHRAAAQVGRLRRRYRYEKSAMRLNDHGRPLRFRHADRKLEEAERVYAAFHKESERRLADAQEQGHKEWERFMGPLRAMNARHQWVRADEDGFYKTGRVIDGIPEVRRVPCP